MGCVSSKLLKNDLREEVIITHAWELMEGLEEAVPVKRNSPKSRSVLLGFTDFDARSPLKMLNQFGSPIKGRRFGGKENKGRGYSPKGGVKSHIGPENSCKKALNMSPVVKGSPVSPQRSSYGSDSRRRRSFSPFFDSAIVAVELVLEHRQRFSVPASDQF